MRTTDEINQDISRECLIAGDLQYRVAAYSQALTQTNGRLGILHQELQDSMKPTNEVGQATAEDQTHLKPIEATNGEG